MKRIIVCGCRDWTDRHRVYLELDNLNAVWRDVTIVHGACDASADRFAAWWADIVHVPAEPHPADWKTHGKAAGPIRNREMAQAGADLCLAFWDGKSRGTLSMITEAVKAGIPVRIVPKGEAS